MSGDATGADLPRRTPPAVRRHLHSWRHPAILSAAFLSLAAGFAQFGVTATLGDVAAAFGETVGDGPSLAEQVGLSGTALGIGLAVIRIASLGSMPLAALADRFGRRTMILVCCSTGLALTALAATAWSFAAFVVILALARPLLSATNAIAGVIAGEETTSKDRAAALALVAAGYGIGAGLLVVVRALAGDILGFRGVFALILVPLVLVLVLSRWLEEPVRFSVLHDDPSAPRPRFGDVDPAYRRRLLLFASLAFAIAFASGPMNTYLFVYAEGVVGLSPATMGWIVAVGGGPIGLLGLLAGRWSADRLGRRITSATAMVAVAAAGALTYNAGTVGVVAGYLAAVGFGAAFAPSSGALGNEVFPTHVRGTAAGWLAASGVVGAVAGLLAFGMLADLFDGFGPAAIVIVTPVALASALFALLPETRGMELEESAPVRMPTL